MVFFFCSLMKMSPGQINVTYTTVGYDISTCVTYKSVT